MAGWKANNLSLAGRVALASSVLNSLPCYVIQTVVLPVSICDKIDRKIRNFIWGSMDGSRRIHNVNWETVCKPKSLGGLGLRSAMELNKAFLMKVAWNLISKPDELWVKVLTMKYLDRNDRGFVLKRKSGYSSLWRGVLKVWDLMLKGIQYCIKDGRNTKFWMDRWLDSGDVLIDFALDIQGVDLSLSVSEFIDLDGNWDMHKLTACLPMAAVLLVAGMSPPCASLSSDSFAWGLDPKGCFSVQSACILIKELNHEDHGMLWRRVWKWEGPAKIKHFLWLASHGKLMTNAERRKRHITVDVVCPVCQSNCEDTEHVLRRCSFAHLVWRETLAGVVSSYVDAVAFGEWWTKGLANDSTRLVFGVTAWALWNRRNQWIFNDERETVSGVCNQDKFWVHLYSLSWKALQVSQEAPGIARQAHLIGWRPTGEGWVSLNSDGSLYTNPSRAAAGGVLRDGDGRFLAAYAANLGTCSIMRAELRGIVEGMKLAWERGVRKLLIQTDSREAVDLLSSLENRNNQHAILIKQVAELSSRDWVVSIQHIYVKLIL
ncbi:Putative ribonuclease H protein At1g65750 [Linum perenne]